LKRGRELHSRKPVHVSVGNINVDIVFYIDKMPGNDESVYAREFNISPGGAALNYAVAATYYGHYAYLVASTSTHILSQRLIEEVKTMGVDVRYLKLVDELPGVVAVFVSSRGERSMIKYRGANEFLTLGDIPRQLIKEANIIHLASVTPRLVEELGVAAKTYGTILSYDPGLYALEEPENVVKVARYINIIYLNKPEARTLRPTGLTQLLKRGLDLVVVKKGGEGAVVLTGGGRALRGFSDPVRKPVNATGAGDAFAAFFNAAYLDSGDPLRALLHGLSAGTFKTFCKGSILCWDRNLFNKQLEKTYVEDLGKFDEVRLGELI